MQKKILFHLFLQPKYFILQQSDYFLKIKDHQPGFAPGGNGLTAESVSVFPAFSSVKREKRVFSGRDDFSVKHQIVNQSRGT
jgi:hypothetical protein